MNKNIETVNLTKCSNTIMADEIVSKLAEEGIISSLHDELDDPVYGAYGPNPGIEVRVCKKDFVQSLRILKEINETRTKQLPWCPNCGSENVVALKKEYTVGSNFSKNYWKNTSITMLFQQVLVYSIAFYRADTVQGRHSFSS